MNRKISHGFGWHGWMGKRLQRRSFSTEKGSSNTSRERVTASHSMRGPNNLLFSTIIADACGKGYRSLNLGSSSGIEGVERFKEQMGGKIANYVTATFEHPWLRGVRKLRSAK